MIIRILGTKGEIQAQAPKHRKHSGVLIDRKILIDVGEFEFLKYKPELILITHFHPDHAFFAKRGEIGKINIPIYGPEHLNQTNQIKIATGRLKWNGHIITPIPTIHSVKVKSQGYIIEKNRKRIFYSGDLITIEKQFFYLLRKLDLVITEGSFFRKGGLVRRSESGKLYGHEGIPNLVFFFRPFTQRIVFTHFGTWFMKNVAAAREKIKLLEDRGLTLEIADDGIEYEI